MWVRLFHINDLAWNYPKQGCLKFEKAGSSKFVEP